MLIEVIAAFVATMGFGILFNIKGKNLIFAAIGGALAWLVYKLSLNLEISNILSLFISSLAFSTYSEICARLLKTPVTTIVVCALIPLVPGGGMYYTMYAAVQGNIIDALDKALTTLASAGALALGILFISTITKLMNLAKNKYNYNKLKI